MGKGSGICFGASAVTGCTNLKAPTQLRSEYKPERFRGCPPDHTRVGKTLKLGANLPMYKKARVAWFFSGVLQPQVLSNVTRASVFRTAWYSRPELNWDQRFRKPLLYPFELREPELAHRIADRPFPSNSRSRRLSKQSPDGKIVSMVRAAHHRSA